MEARTLNRYVWLYDLLQKRGMLTFEQINNCWKDSWLYDGKPLSKRTFQEHCKEISKLFGIEIKCIHGVGLGLGYLYQIKHLNSRSPNSLMQWVIDAFILENKLEVARNMIGRIQFESIPKGQEYLTDVIDAMEKGVVLEVEYDSWGPRTTTYHIKPYWLKFYRQRWYLLGVIKERDGLRHLSLDRVKGLKETDETFVMPEGISADTYYRYSVGIFVNKELTPQKVKLRVYGKQVEYVRSLPLHHSQYEVYTKHECYSDFTYRVCLTPDLTTQILSMGANVEVLEPASLRQEIQDNLASALGRYQGIETVE